MPDQSLASGTSSSDDKVELVKKSPDGFFHGLYCDIHDTHGDNDYWVYRNGEPIARCGSHEDALKEFAEELQK